MKKFIELVEKLPKQTKIGEAAAKRQLMKFVKNSVEKYEKARGQVHQEAREVQAHEE